MSIKVLVADDSITIQKVIGIIFGGDEYSLTIVDNGKSAVDKAREINPDILLIDVLMPGMTGYEAAELVRSIPALADKPILLLTGSFEPFDEEKAKKCGADDFIAKPFESQQIITKVKELLELGKSRLSSPQNEFPAAPEDFFANQNRAEASPALATPPPFVGQQPAAPINIWSAFTPAAEPEMPEAPPAITASPSAAFEPDVFAIVNEEHDAELVTDATTAGVSPQPSGSQWVPVEEQLFEFEEEAAAPPSLPDFSEPAPPVEESAFGDIALADDAVFPPETVFADFTESSPAPEVPAAPFAPLSDPLPLEAAAVSVAISPAEAGPAASAPAVLTEEQLRAAIAGVSKEVIERIVWEIVPDLAEALIRDAIRKITQGQEV